MSTKKATDAAEKSKTAEPKAEEKKALENTQKILGKTPESKTTVDKTAAEQLSTETSEEGASLKTEITEANNKQATEAAPEVIEKAEAVFQADGQRQSTQINNANDVNDAKTLIERRKEAGIRSEAEQAAAQRVAEIQEETTSVGNPKKFDKDADKVAPLADVTKKAEELLAEPFKGSKPQHIHVGTVEREPNMKERLIVSRFPDGRTTQALVAHESNPPAQIAKATL